MRPSAATRFAHRARGFNRSRAGRAGSVTAFARCGKDTLENEAAPAVGTAARVSFVAVGDNLPEARIAEYADALAGTTGDGDFDFSPIYEPVKPIVETADLAYIKQETHIGGEEIGARGWPSFNTVDQMADAVAATGFDLVASASNHSYDWGAFGAVEHSRVDMGRHARRVHGHGGKPRAGRRLALIEREGITFALLDYTYGVNGFTQADLRFLRRQLHRRRAHRRRRRTGAGGGRRGVGGDALGNREPPRSR